MNISFSPPDITEEEIKAVGDALRSGWITTGPRTKEFEREIAKYLHRSCSAALASATACLEMSMHVLGIGSGDEVITSAYTYTASASCICHVGARPVLVDTLPGSYEMDPEAVERAVTDKTKAIISIDLAGIIYSRYDKLFEIAEAKRNIFKPNSELQNKMGRIAIISDAAHAFGAHTGDTMCGEIADFTAFSFHAVKNLTTAEGGCVVWNLPEADDEEIYKQFMLLSLHGQSKDALEKTKKGSWEYDIVAPYYKCNMTDIMSSIGLVQLKRYEELLKRRKEIIEKYNNGFSGEEIGVLPHFTDNHVSSGHLYLTHVNKVTLEQRNTIIERMADAGIATNVHYKPLPMLTAYKNMGYKIEDYPNAYEMYAHVVTLPLHTKLSDEEVDYVISNFREIIRSITV